jgi:hypothetical protein
MQLADVIQQDQFLDWWQMKADFGIDQNDTVFNLFSSQTAIASANPLKVAISYYKRASSLLGYAANFSSNSISDTFTVDLESLGWSSVSATQLILDTVCDSTGCRGTNSTYHTSPLVLIGGKQFIVTVPRHQCAVFTVNGS